MITLTTTKEGICLKNLRNRFERFCYRNRHRGIPNLMLYICIGSGIVYLMSMINGGYFLYDFLRFDKGLILQGQIWRLFTYVLTYTPGSSFLALIFLYFFYNLSRSIEASMGTFRFNLYYFCGVVLMDVFALIFCPASPVIISGTTIPTEYFSYYIYGNMGYYLHLSMLLTFAATNPNAQFLVLFFIPVKAWFMGLVYLALILIEIFNLAAFFPHNLFPLVALGNFILFMGSEIKNLFPFIQPRIKRHRTTQKTGSIPFTPKTERASTPYTHKCTVCGRTDLTNPEMEFRYCSRCSGYHCYCQDHLNDHTHIQ